MVNYPSLYFNAISHINSPSARVPNCPAIPKCTHRNREIDENFEILAFSNEILTLKTTSKLKSECMVFAGNSLGFQNIKLEFP